MYQFGKKIQKVDEETTLKKINKEFIFQLKWVM